MKRLPPLMVLVGFVVGAAMGCSDDDAARPDSGHVTGDIGISADEGVSGDLGVVVDGAVTDGAEGDGEVFEPDADGCEHLRNGPEERVTPAADQAQGPELAFHHANVITLEKGASGWVHFDGEKGDIDLYVDAPASSLPVKVFSGSTELTAEETAGSVADCTEVKSKLVYELEADGRVDIQLGPATEELTIKLVPVAAGEHGHAHR